MPTVETARGPVPSEALGRVLMHEHLFVGDHELETVFPRRYALDREQAVAKIATRLEAARELGFSTVVDCTVLGLGRDVDVIRRVAERTEMHIVVATGAYVLRDLPHPLQLRGPGRTAFGGDEPLSELFVADVLEGIGNTGVKAGVLKVATDRFGLTKDVERTLRATAQAHLSTGVPILTHTNARARVGSDQQRILAQEGVDLGRVVIGHCGDTDDLEYLHALLAGGSFLGMDRFGLDYFLPLERRVATVAALCAAGHGDRVVLSHDHTAVSVAYEEAEMTGLAPNSHWDHITRDVLPALRAVGVSEAQIEQMLVLNPREILVPAYAPKRGGATDDQGTAAGR